jgi:tyrosyl-tRNA synthetase
VAANAIAASEAAFSGSSITDPSILETLHRAADGFDWTTADAAGAIALLVETKSFTSNGEARRAIANGGVTINDKRLTDPAEPLPEPIAGEWYVVRLGKRRVRVGRRSA